MKAIHVNWTAPFFKKDKLRGHGLKIFQDLQGIENYTQSTPILLTTILSALWWKKLNGSIKLYTDDEGLKYYKDLGIDSIYDEIDVTTLNDYNKVNASYFWTSGKVHCLGQETEPFVFLDQDFIVRNKLDVEEFNKYDLTIPHWEIPRGYYYFTKEQFEKEITHCPFPPSYNCNSLVPNTSFLWFNNIKLVKEYVNAHYNLTNTQEHNIPEWFWLLTDQGILGHKIREKDYRVSSITSKVFLSDSDHSNVKDRYKGMAEPWYRFLGGDIKDKADWEHLWYIKATFSANPELKEEYVIRYLNEINQNFPQYKNIIKWKN